MAKIVTAITQRSVLLSTNTKNAHIPLHNHNNNVAHQEAKDNQLISSFSSLFLGAKKLITSFINNNQKIKHNGHDKKFMATAIVSGDNQLPEKIDHILNQNAIKEYHK